MFQLNQGEKETKKKDLHLYAYMFSCFRFLLTFEVPCLVVGANSRFY